MSSQMLLIILSNQRMCDAWLDRMLVVSHLATFILYIYGIETETVVSFELPLQKIEKIETT